MERKDMIAKAKDMGLEFKGNISNDDLAELIENAEIALKAAKYETPNEESVAEITKETGKASKLRNLNEMVIANIIPLDERMRKIPSELYSVMTKFGTKKQVVKFNRDQLVFKIIVDNLKEKKALIQEKTEDKDGREVTRHVMSSAFAITTREPTPEEIAKLQGKK